MHRHNDVMDSINKLLVYYLYSIQPYGIVSYYSLVQETTGEYRNLVDSNRCELDFGKDKSREQPSLLKA